jgi:hypothetical protein
VYYVRTRKYGGDEVKGLMQKYMDRSDNSFIQAVVYYPDIDGNQTMIVMGHAELISVFKGKGLCIYYDGTFRTSPKGYYQTFIISVEEPMSELCIPALYVLLTGKRENGYLQVFNYLKMIRGKELLILEISHI